MRLTGSAVRKRAVVYLGPPLFGLGALWAVSIQMPGRSHAGALPPLSAEEQEASRLMRAHVAMLAGTIGERSHQRMRALDSAATYIHEAFAALGYAVTEHTYTIGDKTFRNVEAVLPGRTRPNEIVLVGGHYDSVVGSPGADDNASGVAAVLELARMFRGQPRDRTIKLVAFTNEEPPFFYTADMGSRRYARAARERGDDIVAMLSLETIGYYSDAEASQQYPPILGLFYPSRGDFIGVVGNIGSRPLVRRVVKDFRSFATFPSAGSAAPSQIPGISWSDHWAFWMEDYDGVMITDTAPFRNANYHEPTDTPESLDYDRMARVVTGVARVVAGLATP